MSVVNRLKSWFAPSKLQPATAATTHPADGELSRLYTERIKQATLTGRIQFLPYLSDPTEETDEMRKAYRLMLADPFVKGPLFAKILSVAALDFTVTPSNPDDPQSKEQAEFVEHCLRRVKGGFPQIVWDVLFGGLIEKHSLADKVFEVETRGKYRNRHILRALKPKDPTTYRLIVDEFFNVVRILGLKFNAGQEFNPSDFVYFVNSPLYGVPSGLSDLRAAYRGYWCLDTVRKLRMIMLDKYSGPFMVGRITSEAQRASMEAALKNARGEGFLVLPPEAQVEIQNLMGAGTDDFAKAEADCKEEIVLSILGATLQMMEGSSPNAAGDTSVHKETSELFQWHLAEQLKHLLNEQVIPDLVARNYGTDVEPPQMALGGINLAVLKDELLIDQGLNAMGVPLSRKELYERYNRVPPADPNDAVTQAPPPMLGLGQPSAPVPFDDSSPTETTTGQDSPKARRSGEVALAGADGAEAARLLKTAKFQFVKGFWSACRPAVERVVASRGKQPFSFTDDERQRIADLFRDTLGTAELLGRARIRERGAMVETMKGSRFSDFPTPFKFAENKPIQPLPPNEALDYFRQLVPDLSVKPELFGQELMRDAFTLAVQTEDVLKDKILASVSEALEDALESGESIWETTSMIDSILDQAGVSVSNPQYSEMVARTNMMDAYNHGSESELQSPDMQEMFPAWRYLGIRDGRQGKDHEPHFDQYYPASRSFASVRGPRPYNCRCTFMPIDKYEWADLRRSGVNFAPATFI